MTKRRLGIFENKIWRKICGPVRDARETLGEESLIRNYRKNWA